jgi:glucokinase
MKKNYSIGVDIGGTKICGCIINNENVVAEKYTVITPHTSNIDVVNVTESLIDKLLANKNINEFYGIGISTGGDVHHITGEILSATDSIPNWKGTQLGFLLRKRYSCPVFVDNDGYMAVYAEWKIGSGKDYNDITGLTIGTGLGGGIIANSSLIRGLNNSAANFGFLDCPKIFKNDTDNDHNLEYYLSGKGLIRILKIIHPSSEFNQPQEIFEAFNNNDLIGRKVFDIFFELLKYCIKIIKNTLSPGIVVIGGGIIAKNYDFFERKLSGFREEFSFPVIPSRFNNEAGMVGAALYSKNMLIF